jgi:hypothetical protein
VTYLELSPRARQRLVTKAILAIGLLGLAFRVVVMLESNGSNDFFIWMSHATILREHGFLWAYSNTGEGTPYQLYNHPPLPGLYAMLCASISGSDTHLFAVLFKIPCLIAEIFTAFLLRSIWTRKENARSGAIAFAAYGCALGSIAVSAYHCNTDAVAAAFALLACERSDRGRNGSAGLALAAALSVKLIPIFIAPLLFFRARSWREKTRVVGGCFVVLIPYLPFVAHLGIIAKSTLGYAPRLEHWGLPYLFEMLAADIGRWAGPFTSARMFIIHHGRDFILFVSLACGGFVWWKRRASAYASGSLALLAFLVFSPGFGVQYVIAVAPLLFAYDIGVGFVYATLSGIFVSLVYVSFLLPGPPPYVSLFTYWYSPGTSALGLIAWAYCVLQFFRISRRGLRGRELGS